MKALVTTVTAIVVLALCGTAALAVAPFTCSGVQSGNNWIYTLRNNHASYDVVEWSLRWSVDDTANAALSLQYFDDTAGYVSFPTNWERSDAADEPRFATLDDTSAIMHGGNEKVFTITYKPGYVPAPKFMVAVIESGNWIGWQEAMNVPEPGSVVALLSGITGLGVLFRRRRS